MRVWWSNASRFDRIQTPNIQGLGTPEISCDLDERRHWTTLEHTHHLERLEMETLPGVAPPEQQNTYFYIGQHETKRTVPVTTELGNQAQDAGVSFISLLLAAVCDLTIDGTDLLSSITIYWHILYSESRL